MAKPKLFLVWLWKEGLCVIPPLSPPTQIDMRVPSSHNYPWSSLDYYDHHPSLTHPPTLSPKTDHVCFLSHVIVMCFFIPLSLLVFFSFFLDLKIILVVKFSCWLRIFCIEIIRTIFHLLWSIGYGFNCIFVKLDFAAVYFVVIKFDFVRLYYAKSWYCGVSFIFCEIRYARFPYELNTRKHVVFLENNFSSKNILHWNKCCQRIAIFVKLTENERKLCNTPYEQLSIVFFFFLLLWESYTISIIRDNERKLCSMY